MLVSAAPGREPEQHLVLRNADMIGDHTGWKDPVRQVEMHQRPDAARSHSDVIACRRTLRYQPLPPGMIAPHAVPKQREASMKESEGVGRSRMSVEDAGLPDLCDPPGPVR